MLCFELPSVAGWETCGVACWVLRGCVGVAGVFWRGGVGVVLREGGQVGCVAGVPTLIRTGVAALMGKKEVKAQVTQHRGVTFNISPPRNTCLSTQTYQEYKQLPTKHPGILNPAHFTFHQSNNEAVNYGRSLEAWEEHRKRGRSLLLEWEEPPSGQNSNPKSGGGDSLLLLAPALPEKREAVLVISYREEVLGERDSGRKRDALACTNKQ